MRSCLNCGQKLLGYQLKYCSNSCQMDRRHKDYIEKWQAGNFNESRGINTKNISMYLRRFLEDKFNNKCCLCGWNEINPFTGKVPVEVDHINGNADDNSEENLRLICPNCHSLSPTFRNLNKGHGRVWRMTKNKNSPHFTLKKH